MLEDGTEVPPAIEGPGGLSVAPLNTKVGDTKGYELQEVAFHTPMDTTGAGCSIHTVQKNSGKKVPCSDPPVICSFG